MTDVSVYASLKQQRIPREASTPSSGQVLHSSAATRGALECIDEFKGRRIIGISGGFRRAFMFEQVDEQENVVNALHPENQDYIAYKDETVAPIEQIVSSLEGLKIVEIGSGKLHNVIRTEDGRIFSYGRGEFGSLGLGGSVFSRLPRPISKLDNKKIVAIACGAFHTLALSDIGDLYSWGRGFEGQLGLLESIETASSPQFVTHFFKYDQSKDVKMLKKKPIHKIACGSYHSLAIDNEGSLYSWGEAISGATGTGLAVKQPVPVRLSFKVQDQPRRITKVAGGFSHSICLTEHGEIFAWGLNIKGQVGINDLNEGTKSSEGKLEYKKVVPFPTQLMEARDRSPLPRFTDISCGFSRSFAIDSEHNVWGWGGGNLGFKDKFSQRGPTKLTEGTDNKKFAKVFANEDSLLIFAPFQPTFFKPALVSSKGGTEMTFFGTGFTETGLQSVKIKAGQAENQIKLDYDAKTCTFFCKIISFDSLKLRVNQPVECEISVTLDGKKYFPYDKKLLVYPQKLAIDAIEPKCGTAHGHTEATLFVTLHPLIQQYAESITVGFKNNSKTDNDNKLQDWICVEGTYEDEKILCKFPNIPYFNNSEPFYMVDISLNGQQFTGHPQTVRFYLISETVLTPHEGNENQEHTVTITGRGLFDTPSKELTVDLHFVSQGHEYICNKVIDCAWLKGENERKFTFKMPPLKWILGDLNVTEELLADARKNQAIVKLNLSKKDPIEIGKYRFLPPPPPEVPEEETNKKDSKKDTKKGAKK